MDQEAVAPAGGGGRDLKSPSASEAPHHAVKEVPNDIVSLRALKIVSD